MTNYLEVKNLSKSFDSFQLHNISFTLPKGYIMGLIGPNGSGKTTTIKLILNMLKRNGGEIKIMGLDISLFLRWARWLWWFLLSHSRLCCGQWVKVLEHLI